MSRNLRARDGQASIEWIGAVVLVAGVLALGAALSQGVYVGRTVTRQMARALCIVRAGDCWRDKEPCVVGSKDQHKGFTVHVFFVRLGGGYRAIVEQRSDGTVAVTRAADLHGGVEVTEGAAAKMKLGSDVDAEVGATAQLAVEGQVGGGMTWIVPSMDAADELVDKLHHLHIPSPDAYEIDGGLHGEAGASVVGEAFNKSVEAAKAGIAGDVHGGIRIDRRTGHRTIYVQGSAALSAAAAGGVLGWSRGVSSDIYAVELDGDGRPIDLQITSTGAYVGDQDLPNIVRPAAAMLVATPPHPGGVLQVTTHLDLTERDSLALASAVVGSALHQVIPAPSTLQALRRRIDEEGSVEARVLSGKTSSGGFAVEGALDGAKVGVEGSSETSTLQLRAAASRGLDGQWLPRDDCVDRDVSDAASAAPAAA